MTRCALYRHYDGDQLQYVGISSDPVRRMYEHKCRTEWAKDTGRTVIDWYDTRADAVEAERWAIYSERPAFNLRLQSETRVAPASDILALIDSWPTRRAFADAVGANLEAVHKWAKAGRIPSGWLLATYQAAQIAGLEHVTAEWLLEAHATHQREKGAAA